MGVDGGRADDGEWLIGDGLAGEVTLSDDRLSESEDPRPRCSPPGPVLSCW